MPEQINYVVVIFGGFMTIFAGLGVWTFATALLTRKSEVKLKDSSASATLEKESREFRAEVRQELKEAKDEIRDIKIAVIPLTDMLEALWPKMIVCLTSDEADKLRDRINVTKLKT